MFFGQIFLQNEVAETVEFGLAFTGLQSGFFITNNENFWLYLEMFGFYKFF